MTNDRPSLRVVRGDLAEPTPAEARSRHAEATAYIARVEALAKERAADVAKEFREVADMPGAQHADLWRLIASSIEGALARMPKEGVRNG